MVTGDSADNQNLSGIEPVKPGVSNSVSAVKEDLNNSTTVEDKLALISQQQQPTAQKAQSGPQVQPAILNNPTMLSTNPSNNSSSNTSATMPNIKHMSNSVVASNQEVYPTQSPYKNASNFAPSASAGGPQAPNPVTSTLGSHPNPQQHPLTLTAQQQMIQNYNLAFYNHQQMFNQPRAQAYSSLGITKTFFEFYASQFHNSERSIGKLFLIAAVIFSAGYYSAPIFFHNSKNLNCNGALSFLRLEEEYWRSPFYSCEAVS